MSGDLRLDVFQCLEVQVPCRIKRVRLGIDVRAPIDGVVPDEELLSGRD